MAGKTIRERKLEEIKKRGKKLTPEQQEAAARLQGTKGTPTATQNPPFTSSKSKGKRTRFFGLEGPFTARGKAKETEAKIRAERRKGRK